MNGIIVTVAAVSLMVFSNPASAQRASTKKPDRNALNLSVKNNGRTLLITNKSAETYRKMEIRLVVGLDFNSYVAPLKEHRPRQNNFRKSGGRNNQRRHPLQPR